MSVLGQSASSSCLRLHVWHLWHGVGIHILLLTGVNCHTRSYTLISLDHRWSRRGHLARSYACLPNLRGFSRNCLQSQSTSGFLTVENMAIFTLLLDLQLPHLVVLSFLHCISLSCDLSDLLFLNLLDLFTHQVLVHLIIQHAFVWVFHVCLVHALLLYLLLCLHNAPFFTISFKLFDLLLFFLLLNCKVSHMLRVDVSLLIESCSLLGQISLLVGIPRIVLEFWHRRQVASRLTWLHPNIGDCTSSRIHAHHIRSAIAITCIDSLELVQECSFRLASMVRVGACTHLSHNCWTRCNTVLVPVL